MKKDTEHLLPYARRADFHVGRATDLVGRKRAWYRVLEVIPGLASWMTLIAVVLMSMYLPTAAAYFIIAFAVYWLLKTTFLSYHLRYNYKRLMHNMKLDWQMLLEKDGVPYGHLHHMVILPFYKEGRAVVRASLASLKNSKYDLSKLIVVLAREERAGKEAEDVARAMQEEFGDVFGSLIVTAHPVDIEGELIGKGSNASWAAEEARVKVLDARGIAYKDVIVSIFDIDTVVYPDYFNCLTRNFLKAKRPLKSSFQPVPVFNNNLWDAPPPSRVVAMSSTFWEMVQQERPERMATFSSHAVPFQALYEVGYWQRNMVSEDSRIFWNLLVANEGEYDVIPLTYPVSMDANVAPTFLGTLKNIYKQHRRWTYGVENLVYMMYHFKQQKKMSIGKRITILFQQGEGYWSLVTNPIMLFLLGWMPLYFGGRSFHETVLSYTLPIIVRDLLTIAMFGLVVSAIISISMLPPRPHTKKRFEYVVMALQWVMVPVTMIIFSSIPGLDAQTRLMFGKYMGFWVTPKEKVDKE